MEKKYADRLKQYKRNHASLRFPEGFEQLQDKNYRLQIVDCTDASIADEALEYLEEQGIMSHEGVLIDIVKFNEYLRQSFEEDLVLDQLLRRAFLTYERKMEKGLPYDFRECVEYCEDVVVQIFNPGGMNVATSEAKIIGEDNESTNYLKKIGMTGIERPSLILKTTTVSENGLGLQRVCTEVRKEIARALGIKNLSVRIRPGNNASLASIFKQGLQVSGITYAPDVDDKRIILQQDLDKPDTLPEGFDTYHKLKIDIPRRMRATTVMVDSDDRQVLQSLTKQGYRGVAMLNSFHGRGNPENVHKILFIQPEKIDELSLPFFKFWFSILRNKLQSLMPALSVGGQF